MADFFDYFSLCFPFWPENSESTESIRSVQRNAEDRKPSGTPSDILSTSNNDTITRSSISSKRSTGDTLQLISRLSQSFLMINGNDANRKRSTPASFTTADGDSDKLNWDASLTLLFGDLMKSS
ncbi:unnamed protein product [Trichobilharzia regenti]|nr:unnamed protein product [Trichobilharzia regenti]